MIFYYARGLTPLKTNPDTVVQSSEEANVLRFIAPYPSTNVVTVSFVCADGYVLAEQYMTQCGQIYGVQSTDGDIFAMWKIDLPSRCTAYAGRLQIQFRMIVGSTVVASVSTSVNVLKGTPRVLPPEPDDFATVYDLIYQAFSQMTNIVFDTNGTAGLVFTKSAYSETMYVSGYTGSADETTLRIPPYHLSNGADDGVAGTYYPVTSITHAFTLASLTKVILPDTIGSIAGDAFVGCTALREIILPASLAAVGSGIFKDNDGATNVGIQRITFLGAPPQNIENIVYKSTDPANKVTLFVPHEFKSAYESAVSSMGSNHTVYTVKELAYFDRDSAHAEQGYFVNLDATDIDATNLSADVAEVDDLNANSLDVTGDVDIGGDAQIDGDLKIGQDDFPSDLNVTGKGNFGDEVEVNGDITANGTVNADNVNATGSTSYFGDVSADEVDAGAVDADSAYFRYLEVEAGDGYDGDVNIDGDVTLNHGDLILEEGNIGSNGSPVTEEYVKKLVVKGVNDDKNYNAEDEFDKVETLDGHYIGAGFNAGDKFASKSFVNSSVENVAAYYETDSTKKPFATKAALNAMTANQFYSGDTQRAPTRNDYTIVESDESNPLEMQGYTQWDATSDYVGAYVLYNGNYTLVTDANKDSLGIVAGTTKAYTLPTTRYVYLGAPDSAYNSANWALQWVVNATGYTAAQIDAINSGITAALVAQITANANNITGLQNRLPTGDNGTLATENYVDGELQNYLPTGQIKTLFINQIGNTYVYDKLVFIVQITAEDFDEPDPTNGVHIVLDGNGTIQWGDGQSEDFESGGVDHSYGAAGVYVIYIDGATDFNASDTHIVSATIPSTFSEIPADAFKNNIGLMSVMIPSSVTSIGAGAFDGITDQTFKEIFYKGNADAWGNITVGADNDILSDTDVAIYYLTDGYEVKYIAQTLNATQKAQARQNIGAQEAGSYVPTTRKIADNALTDDISKSTLFNSLFIVTDVTVDED